MKFLAALKVVFIGMFYILTALFTNFIGLEGVALAHSVNYVIYWLVMVVLMTKAMRQQTSLLDN